MIESLSFKQARESILYICDQIIANQEYLDKVDQPIGDGDHGTSMARGFKAVIEMINKQNAKNIEELFFSTGNMLIYSIGGSAGIIFGTFFREGSKAFTMQDEINSANFADFLQMALDSIMRRGNAKPGDKTLVDALYPAAVKAQEMREKPLSDALDRIEEAALNGMESTKSMKANIGRAIMFAERTIGHLDPGSITMYLIFKHMSDFTSSLEVK